MCGMSDEPLNTEQLLAAATAGNDAAWGSLLTAEQERLIRMVAFRMDPRLRGRIDAADVVQEAFVQASAHREDFFRAPEMPLFLWLRKIVCNKLFELHRHHLGTHMRDANRDRPLAAPQNWDDTAESLWLHLSGHLTSPRTAVSDPVRSRFTVHEETARRQSLGDRNPLLQGCHRARAANRGRLQP